jgi:hypothetical protein
MSLTKEQASCPIGERGTYLLKDIKVTVWNGRGLDEVPIQESIFYRSLLENNREIYDEYRDLIHATTSSSDRVVPFENFVELVVDIGKNGWRNFPIVIRRGQIHDGQHRAAALLFLDKNVRIRIENEKAHPIPTKTIKLAWEM